MLFGGEWGCVCLGFGFWFICCVKGVCVWGILGFGFGLLGIQLGWGFVGLGAFEG